MATVYIETSIVSYLRQKPSTQVITAAKQLLTHKWWDEEREKYDLVTSNFVIQEASEGNPTLAAERLKSLEGIPLLSADPEVGDISDEIMARAILPAGALIDSLHIAIAAHHRIEYLMTWNCTHIANGRVMARIRDLLNDIGVPLPVICTPQEMVEDESEYE